MTTAADPPFAPIRPNPYIVGNPVRDRHMFFGRDAEFEFVRSRFHATQRGGGLLVFCGERRSGKTSILFQIVDKRLGPEFIPVLIDMQSMAIADEADFLAKISQELLEALGEEAAGIAVPDFHRGEHHAAVFRDFVARVLRHCPGRKLVLLFDEYELFENKIDAGVLSRDVLYILHNLMENQSVFMVFTGSQHLEQRRRDYWRILGASIWKQISYLDPADARRLICAPVEGRVQFAEGTVDAICRLSAGQPFYTQALCQSLVDHLNERKNTVVTGELLDEVVRGLVNNPLPQMIFLWDSLERDEKLALALLAEVLPDDRASATEAEVHRHIRQGRYPLQLTHDRLALALANLFRAELLAKGDSPGYSFRMDLWRQWIRRMHSTWQVIRELGIEPPEPSIRIGRIAVEARHAQIAISIAVLVVAALIGGVVLQQRRGRKAGEANPQETTSATATAALVVQVTPHEAAILIDGQAAGTGSAERALSAGEHRVRVTAAGYAETTQVVSMQPGKSARLSVALRPFLAGLRVVSIPADAQITVDGIPRGRGPVLAVGLAIARPHTVEASSPGHDAARRTVELHAAGSVETVQIDLTTSKVNPWISSVPAGAAITIDGTSHGTALHPVSVPLVLGAHRIIATLAGYLPLDTSVVISTGTTAIDLTLTPEPNGELVVKGDDAAEFYIDGRLTNPGGLTQNSGAVSLKPGTYEVRIDVAGQPEIVVTLDVNSRERLTYDFSLKTRKRAPLPPP